MKKLVILLLLASLPPRAPADADEKLEPLRDARPPIKITEIYADPSPFQEHAEFLELFNAGASAVDLSGWRFTKGIKLIFPPHFVLPARACAVLCSDPEAFKAACDKKVEQPKKRFLAHKGLPGAVLYKARSRNNLSDERDLGSPGSYAAHYSLETQKTASADAIWRLCEANFKATDSALFFEANIDLQSFINYLCASALTQNWDAYNKNHFLALDRRSKKWFVIPWDLDRTLGDWNNRFDVSHLSPLLGIEALPGVTGWNRLLDKFLKSPLLRKRYFERLSQLLADTFTEEKLFPRIDSLARAIENEGDLDRARWGGYSSWRAEMEALKKFIVERRAYLEAELPGGEPEAPRNVSPANGFLAKDPEVTLEAGAFHHRDSKTAHAGSRWQVRAEDSTYSTPAVDHASEQDLTKFTLAWGTLLPKKRYCWRVAFLGSNRKTSDFSAETTFTAADYPMELVRWDLSRYFTIDGIANPGDEQNDALDPNGGLLNEEGFDGSNSYQPRAQGVPKDRVVGMHLLGDYSSFNVLQTTAGSRKQVRVKVTQGKYAFARFVVTGGNGDSEMPVRFEFSDGTTRRAILPCDDWYDDNPPDGPAGSVHEGAVPILNGLDRFRHGAYKDKNDAALFEVSLPVDPEKELVAFILEVDQARYSQPGTCFNLFAATGILARGK